MPALDAIVLGVGTFGAAAASELARRGGRVLGLEQFALPHTRGSHHGHSRMFRTAYYEHPDYVPLLQRAFDQWKSLESRSGQSLFQVTGALYMGRDGNELVERSADSARRHAIPHERLSHAELAARFPLFRLPDDHAGIWEPRAGFIHPEAAVVAMADEARRAGAEIRENEQVLGWNAGPAGVAVTTSRGTFHAAKLIITAGAWSAKVVSELGIPLTVTRQVQGWVTPSRAAPFALDRFPCWAVEQPDGSLLYGFPIHPGAPGLKVARHARGRVTDPDDADRATGPGDEAEFLPLLSKTIPAAAGPIAEMSVCLYTNSPDSHFILDRHPRAHDRVAFMCGSSGHGFKFAPVIGEALADLTMNGRTTLPVEFLSLRRFAART